MRDSQLTNQMSDFGKRKSSGPGDPPKKTASKTSSSSPKTRPESEVGARNTGYDRLVAKFGKTHYIKNKSDKYRDPYTERHGGSNNPNEYTLWSKKTGHSFSARMESDSERSNREQQAKNPKPKATSKVSTLKAKEAKTNVKPTASYEKKRATEKAAEAKKSMTPEQKRAALASKNITRANAIKSRKAAVKKSNDTKRAALKNKNEARAKTYLAKKDAVKKSNDAKRAALKNKK